MSPESIPIASNRLPAAETSAPKMLEANVIIALVTGTFKLAICPADLRGTNDPITPHRNSDLDIFCDGIGRL
jgi:hypothetical protein